MRASDGRYYGTLDVTVTVSEVNEAPEIRSDSKTEISYQENRTSTLYTYRATDPEGDPFRWSLSGADGGLFTISETGVLTFNSSPDYENEGDVDRDNDYEVTSNTDAGRDGDGDRPERTAGCNGPAEPDVRREPADGPGAGDLLSH